MTNKKILEHNYQLVKDLFKNIKFLNLKFDMPLEYTSEGRQYFGTGILVYCIKDISTSYKIQVNILEDLYICNYYGKSDSSEDNKEFLFEHLMEKHTKEAIYYLHFLERRVYFKDIS